MARAALGSLVVSLGLDAAEFSAGLSRSEYQAKKFITSIEGDAKKIGAAIGVAATAAATSLFLITKNAIDAADKMNDLSKATGLSVEVIGGLGFAAEQSGSNLEGVAKAVGKLNLNIAAAAAGPGEAREAFDAMGISVKDLAGNIKTADVVLTEVADKFASYEDGPNKAALGNRAFGKSYQEILPLLDEGGKKLQENIEYFNKYGGITTEVAKQADEFNDTLTKLGLLSGAFGRNLAAQLLPSLQALANTFVEAKEKGDGFKKGAAAVAEILKTLAVGAIYTAAEFRALGTVIGARAAQLAALARLDFKSASFIGEEVAADIAEQYKARDALIGAIRTSQATLTDRPAGGRGRRPAPGLPGAGGGAAKERQSDAERYLQSLQKQQEQLQELSVTEQLLRDIQMDRIKNVTHADIDRLLQIAQQIDATKAQKKAEEEAARAAEERARAEQQLTEHLLQESARIRESNIALQDEVTLMGASEQAVIAFAKAKNDEAIARAQVRLEQAPELKLTELQTQELQTQIELLRERNAILTSKAVKQQLLEDAQAAKKFNDIFADSFTDAFVSVIDGTKSLSAAFKDMEKQIVSAISRIAAQNIAKAILGVNDAGGGGIGALFAKLFAGGGSAAAGAGWTSGFDLPAFASGGTSRGGWAMVGERGSEAVHLPRGAQVIPNDVLMARRSQRQGDINIHVNVPSSTSAATADQIAVRTGMAVRRALNRNA